MNHDNTDYPVPADPSSLPGPTITLMLCERAVAYNGSLFIHAGAVANVISQAYPTSATLAAAVVVAEPPRSPFQITFSIVDADGQQLVSVTSDTLQLAVSETGDVEKNVAAVFDISSMVLPKPGRYRAAVELSTGQRTEHRFAALLRPSR